MKNAGHQNVYDADPTQFMSRMRAFVADVNERAGGRAFSRCGAHRDAKDEDGRVP